MCLKAQPYVAAVFLISHLTDKEAEIHSVLVEALILVANTLNVLQSLLFSLSSFLK